MNILIMKHTVRFLIIIYIGCMVSSCRTIDFMTKEELVLIKESSEDAAFRVLTILDPDDLRILRTKCNDINLKDDTSLKQLISRLKITMEEERGVGIAAPQVGLSRNLFLFMRIDKPGNPIEVAINPRIVNYPKETVCFEGDGCLSIPGISGNTVRYPWVEVEYTNESGERIKEKLEGHSRLDNFTGIIFQHEFDHLQGVLFTDKLCEEEPIQDPSTD